MAKDGQPSRPRIRLALPGEWTTLPAWYPELDRAWQAAVRAVGRQWINPDRFLQECWQTPDARVQLRGRWDWVHAEFTTLDWPLPERHPAACYIAGRDGRILVNNGARVVHDVQIRRQPDAAETAGAPPASSSSSSTKPPRKTKAENDAADDAVLDGLIRAKKMREPTDPKAGSDYSQAKAHSAAFPRLQGGGTSTKNQQARAIRALQRRRAETNQPSPM